MEVINSYTIVGFRLDQQKSVYYKTADNAEDCGKRVEDAFNKKCAHFVSVRRIYKELKNETN